MFDALSLMMILKLRMLLRTILFAFVWGLLFLITGFHAKAEELCAEVQIEIAQELTFERQAFDAAMRITNGLQGVTLDAVNVDVEIKDENGVPVVWSNDPNNTSALFFVVIDSLSGIGNVSGTGVVQPQTVAEIHWLIIPAPGAAGTSPSGKAYSIGAHLSYEVNGERTDLDVAPDFVMVRPQPELQLDYFLQREVRGDDPTTMGQVEPSEPFTLGLRIKNTGLGTAWRTRVESSQPRIVNNALGLNVGFQIIGSYVDDQPTQPTLLIDFGDVMPLSTRTGRWVMESTLSGRFESFSVNFSHADELGGRLTSLILGAYPHDLIKDVRVDLPGRDGVKDFLAEDSQGTIKMLYESEGLDTLVTDQSSVVTVTNLGTVNGVTTYALDVPQTAGPLFVSLPDPHQGTKSIRSARRGDGKVILEDNVWFMASDLGATTSYSFNLFDVNGGGRYFVEVGDRIIGQQPPVIQNIPNYTVEEGHRLTFIVRASDPNGTIPSLSVDSLPVGASFQDFGDGTGEFDWQVGSRMSGSYPITFRASDGVLSSARTPVLRVLLQGDSDGDGMLDTWELEYFGDLSRDGTGDFDGDGLTDLEEFQRGTDPTLAANAPGLPSIYHPRIGHEVDSLRPTMIISNASHSVEEPVYAIEIFSDKELTQLVASDSAIPEVDTVNLTTWTVDTDLNDNTWYYWRVRASLAAASSEWVYGKFFVNTQNDVPTVPLLVRPLQNEQMDSRVVKLSVLNASDPDEDEVSYQFEVQGMENSQPRTITYPWMLGRKSGRTDFVAHLPVSLQGPYRWRVKASDSHGGTVSSSWADFRINTAGFSPGAPLPLSPGSGEIVTARGANLIAKIAPDFDMNQLSYSIQIADNQNFLTPTIVNVPSGDVNNVVVANVSNLADDTTYYWRIRAFDGTYFGPWAYSSFKVNNVSSAPTIAGVTNPGTGSRVDSLRPALNLVRAINPDGSTLNYIFEVYSDDLLTNLIDSATVSDSRWEPSVDLNNFETYYWRAKAESSAGQVSDWTSTHALFVSKDSVNDAPFIRAVPYRPDSHLRVDRLIEFQWEDYDIDSNAEVYMFLNGNWFQTGRTEDLDGDNDIIRFQPNSVPAGQYEVKVAISDGRSYYEDSSCCQVTIDPVPPNQDSDGDGVPDVRDNCPYISNPLQEDVGGIGPQRPDGIGDACQCGDLDGNGIVTLQDAGVLRSALDPNSPVKLRHPELCNVSDDSDCTLDDAGLIEAVVRRVQNASSRERLPSLCEVSHP